MGFFDKIRDTAEGITRVAGVAADLAREQAEKAVDKAGEMLDSNLDQEGPQYCSWCFTQNTCTKTDGSNLSRNVYVCDGCGAEIVKCRACSNFAKHGEGWGWDNQFCAVHSGAIGNFENLNKQLEDLTDYHDVVKRGGMNFKKVGTTAACITGGAAVIGPLALWTAPAIGGAIGAKFLGLTGAAATKGGLAMLGGGAVAAGGYGMAGGVAVITAAGSALGGRMGGVISNSYFGDIKGFEIEKLQDGEGPALLCIDGFLTQKDKDLGARWLDSLPSTYDNNPVYLVRWESKRLHDIARSTTELLGGHVGAQGVLGGALAASKMAAKKVMPAASVLSVLNLSKNPWSVARYKAAEAGALLADLIARTDQSYILVGHSLGARVIYFCLRTLESKSERYIEAAHLLGGAVDNGADEESADEKVNWAIAARAVKGRIVNYHSENDDVLRYLYSAGEFFLGEPIGRNRIDIDAVLNVDVSRDVGGHTQYKPNLAKIMVVQESESPPLVAA